MNNGMPYSRPGISAAPVLNHSASIVVSGYAPVAATAVFVGSWYVGAVMGAPTIRELPQGIAGPIGYWGDEGKRCYHCLRTVKELDPGRLGMRAFCIPCVDRLARVCQQRNGRLPHEKEFYCSRCGSIVGIHERPPDGRWRCRACRRSARYTSLKKMQAKQVPPIRERHRREF